MSDAPAGNPERLKKEERLRHIEERLIYRESVRADERKADSRLDDDPYIDDVRYLLAQVREGHEMVRKRDNKVAHLRHKLVKCQSKRLQPYRDKIKELGGYVESLKANRDEHREAREEAERRLYESEHPS